MLASRPSCLRLFLYFRKSGTLNEAEQGTLERHRNLIHLYCFMLFCCCTYWFDVVVLDKGIVPTWNKEIWKTTTFSTDISCILIRWEGGGLRRFFSFIFGCCCCCCCCNCDRYSYFCWLHIQAKWDTHIGLSIADFSFSCSIVLDAINK